MVHQDYTVRDADNTVVQFQYGEDSMDICKSQYIKPDKLTFLGDNLESVHNQQIVLAAKSRSDLKAVKAARKELKKWSKRSKGKLFIKLINNFHANIIICIEEVFLLFLKFVFFLVKIWVIQLSL